METESRSAAVSKQGHPGWSSPDGDDSDDLPKLWETNNETDDGIEFDGEWQEVAYGTAGPAGVQLAENRVSTGLPNWSYDSYDQTSIVRYLAPHAWAPRCDTTNSSPNNGPRHSNPSFVDAADHDTYECSIDRVIRTYHQVSQEALSGSPIAFQGCSVAYPQNSQQSYYNLTRKHDVIEELEDEFTKDALRNDAMADMAAEDWAEEDGAVAESDFTWPIIGDVVWGDCEAGPDEDDLEGAGDFKEIRWRCTIPHDFDPPPAPSEQRWHGTWHKIELKETFTPAAYDEQDAESPQPQVTIRTAEWTGPGTEIDFDIDGDYTPAEQTDLDSWKTTWVEIDPPQEAGTTSIEIYRSQCYHGAPWVYHQSTGQ